jgi:hypothetical protein
MEAALHVDVNKATCITGEDNKQCDRLSRRWGVGKTPFVTVLDEAEGHGFDVETDVDPSVRRQFSMRPKG